MMVKKNIPVITIIIITLIMVLVSNNLNWTKNSWTSIIEADAKGYYAYLPATFIYKDLNFGFFDEIEKEKYFNENMYYDYRSSHNGKIINKYYCGTAVAQFPFFLIAHGLSRSLGHDADGYSKPYMVSVSIATLFYFLIGLLFLNRILQTYSISPINRSIVLFASAFGTNIFYYTSCEPGLSHIFSFAFISIFIYTTRAFFKKHKSKYIILSAAVLAMIILIRPINVLVVLSIPFLSGSLDELQRGFKKLITNKKSVFGIAIGLAIFSIQLVIYKISTGSFFVYSYGEEGFNFLAPNIIDILFSYKKGLFLYTPLLFIALLGGYHLWKKNNFSAYTIFGFLFILTYVFSSWHNWWYGGSFSSRVYLEFIPFFAILLAIAIQHIASKIGKRVYLSLAFLLIIVCQIQTYQYRYYDIHWEDMTKEKYWNVFLRIDKYL